MNRKGTILLPILVVLIIISLAIAGGSVYFYQKEHAQNIQLQEQIVELEKRQKDTETKLEASKKIAAEFQLKLQETRNQVDSLTEELTQEKSAHTETSNKLDQFTRDLAQQKSLRQDLEDKLNQLQEDSRKTKEQLKLIQQQKAELEEKIKNAEVGESGVELGKVVVNNDANVSVVNPPKDKIQASEPKVTKVNRKEKAPQLKVSEGKVMVVNKEFNFAVINLGSKDGIKLGDEFSVLSNSGNPIGDLKVEKVHESMSAAGFSADLKDFIKENDKIAQKVK